MSTIQAPCSPNSFAKLSNIKINNRTIGKKNISKNEIFNKVFSLDIYIFYLFYFKIKIAAKRNLSNIFILKRDIADIDFLFIIFTKFYEEKKTLYL